MSRPTILHSALRGFRVHRLQMRLKGCSELKVLPHFRQVRGFRHSASRALRACSHAESCDFFSLAFAISLRLPVFCALFREGPLPSLVTHEAVFRETVQAVFREKRFPRVTMTSGSRNINGDLTCAASCDILH